MQNTEDQHNVSDANSRNRQNLLKRRNFFPAGEAEGNISEIDQVIAPQQNAVDRQAEIRLMNQVFQIDRTCPVASSSYIHCNVETDGKEKQIR